MKKTKNSNTGQWLPDAHNSTSPATIEPREADSDHDGEEGGDKVEIPVHAQRVAWVEAGAEASDLQEKGTANSDLSQNRRRAKRLSSSFRLM